MALGDVTSRWSPHPDSAESAKSAATSRCAGFTGIPGDHAVFGGPFQILRPGLTLRQPHLTDEFQQIDNRVNRSMPARGAVAGLLNALTTVGGMGDGMVDVDIEGLAVEHEIPGAVVGVWVDGRVSVASFGVLNIGTGVQVTADSVFQIGSITKLWTATVIMQLAEEQVLDLEGPVADYVPGFRIGSDGAAASITIRQLLTHTSGLCDDYTPTTRGDDAVERYVADVLPNLTLEFSPGEGFMYSNAGYVVLGRVAEVLRGQPYPVLLRERIATPLGLQHWAATPEEALLFRTSVGHVPTGPGGQLQPASVWSMSAAHAPAGSQVAMSAASLLAFAAAHLHGGDPLVSAQTIQQMWNPEPGLPELGGAGGRLAIGGVIQHVGDSTIVGYDGATYGQSASLRMIPDAGVAVVSLANGGNMFAFHQAVLSGVVADTARIELPGPPVPPQHPEPVDSVFVAGRYRGRDLEAEVNVDDEGRVWVSECPLTEELKTLLPGGPPAEYVRLDAQRLIGLAQSVGVHPVITFSGEPTTPASHLAHFGRTLERMAPVDT